MKTALACALCALVGAGGAWWFASSTGAPKVDPPVAVRDAPAPARTVPTPTEVAVLRGIMREELAAALKEQAPSPMSAVSASAALAAPAASAQAPDPDEERNLEPSPVFVQAQAQVQASIAKGKWTEQDREQVSGELGRMTQKERDEVMRSVSRALNAGMRVDFAGPPFL